MVTACSTTQPVPLTEQQRKIYDLNERALASAQKGYDDDTQKLLQEALRLAASLDDREGQILTLLNQSRLARHNGMLQQAGLILEQAITKAVDTPFYADVAQEKALLELAANHLDEATHWAELAKDAEQGSVLGRRFNLLARIALRKNDLDKANRLAEQALTANNDAGQELERANSLRILGVVKTQTGQWEKARELLQQALVLDKQQAVPLKIATDLEALAELAALKKELTLQQDYLQRARLVRESNQISTKK
jgi:tetratricopeptide (TPR) repeat protein